MSKVIAYGWSCKRNLLGIPVYETVKTHLSLLLCYSGINTDLPKSHCNKDIALLIAVAYGQHSRVTYFIDYWFRFVRILIYLSLPAVS